MVPILLNSALAAVKNDELRIAIRSTDRALSMDITTADRAKAYYRRALAHLAMKDDEDAERDLVDALKLVPGDEAIRKELDKVRTKKKEKRDREKKAFKGLFA